MPNLINELGAEYVSQMYSGALFLHDNEPHMFDRARGDFVTAHKVVDKRWSLQTLAYADFPDMSKFAWPALGYRNVQYKKHNLVVEVGHARSTKRGLRAQLLTAEPTKAALLFNYDISWIGLLGDDAGRCETVLKPTYFTMEKAREYLYDGKAVSCAINSNLALEINPFSEDPRELSVLWKGAKIGSMLGDGTLEVPKQLALRIKR